MKMLFVYEDIPTKPPAEIGLGARVSSFEAVSDFFVSDRMGELEPKDMELLELSWLEDSDVFDEKNSLFLNTISRFC